MTCAIHRSVALSLAACALATPAMAHDDAVPGAFAPCDDQVTHPSLAATQCMVIAVPLDHAATNDGTVELFVRKFPVEGIPQGQLWLIAGGPGESGASLYPFIDTLRAAAPGFELLVPDHRGTGLSTRLCPGEEAPESAAGSALAGEEWATCFASLNEHRDRTQSFTITNAARDLDELMSRLGSGERRYVYGVSYGTQLVLRLLSVSARTDIDGVILDSLVPFESDTDLDLSHRSALTDRAGREVLRDCDTRPECRWYFPDGVEHATSRLLARPDIAEQVDGNLKYQLAALLDFPETRAMLPHVIAGLQANDPAWLAFANDRLGALSSALGTYPQSASSIPLVGLISRSENNARPDLTAEIIEREEQAYLFASPLPSLLVASGIPTYPRDTNFGSVPAAIPPSLVLHGTLDPKTPHHGATEHVAKLKASGDITLIPINGAPHFILMTAPGEFKRAVEEFLGKQ